MGLRVATNIPSLAAQKEMGTIQRDLQKSFAQLSSGSRITKAADDAAGLSISEVLKSTIRGYRQAHRNAEDGVSMVQVAEGGMNEISNMLVRMRELAVQSASDTIGDRERKFVDLEAQQLKNEIERIAQTTRFGSIKLLDGSGDKYDFQIDINNNDFQDRIQFDAGKTNVKLSALGVDGLALDSKGGAHNALEVLEEAQVKVNGQRANLGAIQNRLISTQENLSTSVENFSAANSRIRDTDIAMSSADLARNQVLQQATIGVMAQANQSTAVALKLIA
jgi:flagellin